MKNYEVVIGNTIEYVKAKTIKESVSIATKTDINNIELQGQRKLQNLFYIAYKVPGYGEFILSKSTKLEFED